VIRCPVCQSTTVTVVLNSKSHASCARCGATWIQEGSWQRYIRPARHAALVELPEDVVRLPRSSQPEPAPALEPHAELVDPAEEAVGT